jgi:hypothetical protein
MAIDAKKTPCVNARMGKHSCLTLVGADFTGVDVDSKVVDKRHGGEWVAHKSKKSTKTEMRITLRTTKPPVKTKDEAPDGGNLTITFTGTAPPPAATVPIDYVDDDP